jgi:hypothetical protein
MDMWFGISDMVAISISTLRGFQNIGGAVL